MSLGLLDRSFAANGGAFIPITGARACAVAVDGRGRILIAGNITREDHREDQIVLARLTREGNLDRSFGSRGILGLPTYTGCRCSGAILLDPDGYLFLTATSHGPAPMSWLVNIDPHGEIVEAARRHPIGAPSESARGRWLRLSVLADVGDGNIAGAGAAGNSGDDNPDFAVGRFDPRGELDTSFGHSGVATTNFAGRRFEASSLLIDAASRVLAVGTVSDSRSAHPAILRYLQDGQLDTSFGTGGLSLGDFGGIHDRALTGQLLPSGRILIAGSSRSSSSDRPAFAAYTPDGVLDPDFGSQGHGPEGAPELQGAVTCAALDATGKAVLAGRLARGPVSGVGLTRLTERGRLDPVSGVGGVLLTQLRGRGGAVAVAIDPYQGIIVAAETETADGFVALRYVLPATSFAPPLAVPYLSRADLEAQQQKLMRRIQHDHEMATIITRGIQL